MVYAHKYIETKRELHTFGSTVFRSLSWALKDRYTLLLSGFSDPGKATEYGVPFGGGCASSSARKRCAGLDEKKTIVYRL